MAKAKAANTTILRFPIQRKRTYTPRLTNDELRASGAHLLDEQLYRKPDRTTESALLYAMLMALPLEISVKVAATTTMWAGERPFEVALRQAEAIAMATMEARVRKASRELDRAAKMRAI